MIFHLFWVIAHSLGVIFDDEHNERNLRETNEHNSVKLP